MSESAPLALHVHESAGPARASVVLGAAIGVPQRYYQDFAAWLARQGFRVTTFDYPGQGESLAGPLRRARTDLWGWARDYGAVVAQTKAALPDRPLYLVGHSMGAQLPGLLAPAVQAQVDGLLAIAAGSGYWRDLAPPMRRGAHLFWYVLLPLATLACGYFPGARLNLIGDLPAGVAWQWRRWCLHPRYSVGVEGEAAARSYAGVRFPIHALSFTDDEMMTLRGTEALLALYSAAPQHIERIAPGARGVARIGHLGFFRAANEAALWPLAADALARWAAGFPAAPAVASTTQPAREALHTATP